MACPPGPAGPRGPRRPSAGTVARARCLALLARRCVPTARRRRRPCARRPDIAQDVCRRRGGGAGRHHHGVLHAHGQDQEAHEGLRAHRQDQPAGTCPWTGTIFWGRVRSTSPWPWRSRRWWTAASRVTRRVLDASSMPSASIFVNIIRGVIWALACSPCWSPCWHQGHGLCGRPGRHVRRAVLWPAGHGVKRVQRAGAHALGKVVQPGDYVEVAGFEGFVTDVNWRHTTVQDRWETSRSSPTACSTRRRSRARAPPRPGSCGVDFLARPDADLPP